jgi:hypothetical protein
MSADPLPPSYMSLPKASARPIMRMGFSYTARKRLISNGIVSALQLAEIASRSPQMLKHLTGVSAVKARRLLEAELGILPDFSATAVTFEPLPATGVPELPVTAANPASPAPLFASENLRHHLSQLATLPQRVSLSARMQPVGNQGAHGTCVGWAADAVHEFNLGRPMSAGYRGAKSLDGWHGEGSWLRFAFEHFFRTGHVEDNRYSYGAAIRQEPIDLLSEIARHDRARGFAPLPLQEPDILVPLMRAVLAGRLNPAIGQKPIAVSLRLHNSFTSTSTALDGLIPLPFPGEHVRGGHAMVVVGYVDADEASNPFGLDYFIVRNSWGSLWAGENPFGEPGHAMIPGDYFRKAGLVMEAFICLGS